MQWVLWIAVLIAASSPWTEANVEGLLGKKPAPKCKNIAKDCAAHAAAGHCEGFPAWMTFNCPVECDFCEKQQYSHRCSREALNTTQAAYAAGDIGRMFLDLPNKLNKIYGVPQQSSRLSLAKKRLKVLSRDPWVVTIDKFVTEEEIEALLSTQPDPSEWGRSLGVNAAVTDVEAADQGVLSRQHDVLDTDSRSTAGADSAEQAVGVTGDGTDQHTAVAATVVDPSRTSTNSWCDNACEAHPAVTYLIQKIQYLVNVPHTNYENFQVLKYEVGQQYGEHHDFLQLDTQRPCGPRILTFFLYLSDVEEGGETAFPLLNITVRPKKGTALLWPSTLDSNPMEIDGRTNHAALPVKRGRKFAANHWIHLYDFSKASSWGCTGMVQMAPPPLP